MSCGRPLVLQALIGLFELPEDDSIPDDEHFIDIEDTPGYQTAFSQLAFAGKKEHDPIGEVVSNPKILLAQSLHKLSTACPGRVRTSPHMPDFIIIRDVAISHPISIWFTLKLLNLTWIIRFYHSCFKCLSDSDFSKSSSSPSDLMNFTSSDLTLHVN